MFWPGRKSRLLSVGIFLVLPNIIPVLNGVLDERVTYIPLGYNQIFNCEAEAKIAYLVRSQPVWYVLFYNPDTKAMERTNVSSIR